MALVRNRAEKLCSRLSLRALMIVPSRGASLILFQAIALTSATSLIAKELLLAGLMASALDG
jgi:hypothetical protein